MGCSTWGFPVLHHLPEFAQTPVHLVGDGDPTISSSVLPFFCLQFFQASGSFPINQFLASGGQSIGVSASSSILPMNIQDWFPLGLTSLISAVQGTLKSLIQHHSSKESFLWCSASFMVQLSHLYMTTRKTIAIYGPLSAKWCLWFLICCLGLSKLFFQGASIF